MNTLSLSSFARTSPRQFAGRRGLAFLALLLLLSSPRAGFANSATWLANPSSNKWTTRASWSPVTVPNGKAQTATFAFSSKTSIAVPIPITIGTVIFNPGASAFTISVLAQSTYTFAGLGVTNNSNPVQSFVAAGEIDFTRSSAAGAMTSYTARGGATDGAAGGVINFKDLGSAGSGAFVVNGATVLNAGGGEINFSEFTSASMGTFTVNGATLTGGDPGSISFTSGSGAGTGLYEVQGGTVAGAGGGKISFVDSANGNQAVMTNDGAAVTGATGGTTDFLAGSAGNATLIANSGSNGGGGGTIRFEANGKGGSARVQVFGNGSLNVSAAFSDEVTIGLLEGDGDVTLGSRGLTVGAINSDSIFSGLIHDTGSFTKTGDGTLILSGANTYTGGTFVSGGALLAQNRTGSCTGSGPVLVETTGTVGGGGTIAGTVTVGSDGTLGPSKGSPATATLTIESLLTFQANSTFVYRVNTGKPTADRVVANGAAIESGANFSFLGAGPGTIKLGKVIIAIDNTSADPITGAFDNLADGAVFTVGNNSYQVSYEGGDGNDLSLTVVP